jgi:ABC-type Na+ efflux pump permease subunit
VTALLSKDLRLLRPWVWLIVPGHALFAVNGILSPELFFWVNAVLAVAVTVILLTIEWRFDAERFVASLPVSRADVVKARHAGALAVALLATPLYGLYGHALTTIGRDRLQRIWRGHAPGWESWEGYLAFFLVATLASFAFLPFHFRLGLGRGSAVFGASALTLAGFGGLAARSLDGDGPGALPGEVLREWLSRLSTAWDPWLTVAAALAATAGVGALSYRLSLRFYDRRDL